MRSCRRPRSRARLPEDPLPGVGEPTLDRAGAYVDAVRALRPRQLVHRPRRLVPPRLLAAGLSDADPPGWRPLAAGAGLVSAPQSGPVPLPHSRGVFEAVGMARPPGGAQILAAGGPPHLVFAFTGHPVGGLPR